MLAREHWEESLLCLSPSFFLGLWQHNANLPLQGFSSVYTSVSKCPLFIRTPVILEWGHPNDLILTRSSARMAFPRKSHSEAWGWGLQDLWGREWGPHSAYISSPITIPSLHSRFSCSNEVPVGTVPFNVFCSHWSNLAFSLCLCKSSAFSPLCIHIFFRNCLTTATHSLKRLIHAFSSLILAKEMEMERISETGILGWTLLIWHSVRCHLVCTSHAYIKDYDFSYGGIENRPNPMHQHHL